MLWTFGVCHLYRFGERKNNTKYVGFVKFIYFNEFTYNNRNFCESRETHTYNYYIRTIKFTLIAIV